MNKTEQLRALKCPRCRVAMTKLADKDGVIIDKCPRCSGLWLDKEEVDHIKAQGFWKYLRNYWRKDQ